MKVRYPVLYQMIIIVSAYAIDTCPDGSYVLLRGLSSDDKRAATDEHNRFRQMLVDGVVPGQPRAKYMKTMIYDEILAEKCVPISNQCWMNHLNVSDERWHCVGQNIYIAWHSQFIAEQNWTAALASWFYECNDFQYPNTDLTGREVGHYTQVAWADSDTLGCDYILYIDPKKPWTPFCSLYTCNYGPCGNYNDMPPYLLADENQPSCTSDEDNQSSNVEEHTSNVQDHTSTSENDWYSCSDHHSSHHTHTHTSSHTHTSTHTTTNSNLGVGSFLQNFIHTILG